MPRWLLCPSLYGSKLTQCMLVRTPHHQAATASTTNSQHRVGTSKLQKEINKRNVDERCWIAESICFCPRLFLCYTHNRPKTKHCSLAQASGDRQCQGTSSLSHKQEATDGTKVPLTSSMPPQSTSLFEQLTTDDDEAPHHHCVIKGHLTKSKEQHLGKTAINGIK